MENEFVNLPAQIEAVVIEQLRVAKSADFARVLLSANSSTLIECFKVTENSYYIFDKEDEIVVFDTVVEVGQRVENDIRYTERIAIVFKKEDNATPWVFALRLSFPKVLHRLSLPFESPACLCIYEQHYDDLKLNWRSQQFLQDIRKWLAETAIGRLHQDDQPLEPLIVLSMGNLILPHDVKPSDTLFVNLASEKDGRVNLIASRNKIGNTHDFYFMFLTGAVQEHGIVEKTPLNLSELHEFLLKADLNLFSVLQEKIRTISNDKTLVQQKLLLLVQLPKRGTAERLIENDLYVFATVDTLEEVGFKLNVLFKQNGLVGHVVPHEAPIKNTAASVAIYILTPYIEVSKQSANLYSGQTGINNDITIAQIGLGALGSQVFMNLAKNGFGKWKLIDSDILLPHNTVRHFLPPFYLGQPKSVALANEANTLLNQPDFAVGIWENYLHPSDNKSLNEQLQNSKIILDISTSIPVARDLAYRTDIGARRISIFLNPSGTDLIVLAEDAERKLLLDVLEFQYYRAITEDKFNKHLSSNIPIRYSNSCRDITSQISQDHVAVHAGIASAKIKLLIRNSNAMISIWHINDEQGIEKSNIKIEDFTIVKRGEWNIYIDHYLINKISQARLSKLPNETGGILIGGSDFDVKRIYLLDTVLSPNDSEETPTGYIRGKEGLKEILQEIEKRTAGHLVYVGDWHSHPVRCSLDMSEEDLALFTEIKDEMNAIGYPPLMLIAGDYNSIEIYCN